MPVLAGPRDLGPSGNEIGQDLRPDGRSRDVLSVVAHELEHPFSYPPGRFLVVDDFAKREGSHHFELVSNEVVQELALGVISTT